MNKYILLCVIFGWMQYGKAMDYGAQHDGKEGTSDAARFSERDTVELEAEDFAEYTGQEAGVLDESSVVLSEDLEELERALRASLRKSTFAQTKEEQQAFLVHAKKIQERINAQKWAKPQSPVTSAPSTPEGGRTRGVTLGRQRVQPESPVLEASSQGKRGEILTSSSSSSPQISMRVPQRVVERPLGGGSIEGSPVMTAGRTPAFSQDDAPNSPRELGGRGRSQTEVRKNIPSMPLALRKKKGDSGSKRTLGGVVSDLGKKLADQSEKLGEKLKSPRSPRVSPRPSSLTELPEGLDASSKALAILGAQRKESSPEQRKVTFSSLREEGSPRSGSAQGSSDEGSSHEDISPGRKGLSQKTLGSSASPERSPRPEARSEETLGVMNKKEFDAGSIARNEKMRQQIELIRGQSEEVLKSQVDQPWVREVYSEVVGQQSPGSSEEENRRRSYQDFVKSMSSKDLDQVVEEAERPQTGGFMKSAKTLYQSFLQRQKHAKEAILQREAEEEKSRTAKIVLPQTKWKHIGTQPIGDAYYEEK